MTDKIKPLPDTIDELKALVLQLENKYNRLLEQFRLAQHQRFGKSSESDSTQFDLFNETEEEIIIENDDTQTITYTRQKPKRQRLPEDLPRTVIIHDIKDKTCKCCGLEMHAMGKDISEKLEFVPAKVEVIQHVRPKYACRNCEKHNTSVDIKQAPMPASPIPKGIATASLLAQIITAKFQYSLPLYRQETLFQQWGIIIGRRTMADWLIKCSVLFTPLNNELHRILLEQPTLHCDETTVNVLDVEKAKCYMWVYCSGYDSPGSGVLPGIVLYDYQSSRHGYHPVNFLKGYNGYLHTDGYQGYEQTEAILVGCWAHARRRFIEAQRVQVKGKTGSADWVLSKIQKLYRIESLLKEASPEAKYVARQTEARDLLKELRDWLDSAVSRVSPKTKLGEAISYTLNQWDKLVRYIDDGLLSIDNNRAERAVKPFVIGRKNWLFSGSTAGADSSAMLYSIVETAKANGLIPYDYIRYCLDRLCVGSPDIDSLLPWNVKDKV
ncbi:IS66-like element ISVsa2 family transposase [Aliivibrio salmonicida]|uniref:Transposase n=1 Tax=Aliivibrio salmonicida (strain LFI1238) TaxID=316275 RepID=B6ENS9_ALISL|nr:IS66-like element ISVsa2 family transposase [Aliivibrio salmonicida]AZL85957.1 IS66-like element ISVsa2 family transposase [Aliivibrio salmonicida]CAQ80566.1 transposase [Aliivibrio salmonicida LFI1238]